MDPISAIGVASAIVAFVDFSWDLVTGTWEIYNSLDGVNAENARLEDVTDKLASLTLAINVKSDIPVLTAAEKNIQGLAKDCITCAKKLQHLLDGMKAPGGKGLLRKALIAKLKSIWNKNELSGLERQLRNIRAQIQLNITVILR